MSFVQPSVQTWTLRLKYHKSTILLHVEPTQSVESLKENLLFVLRDVKQSPEFLNGRSPPSSAEQIELGKPKDALNLSKGWESLEASALVDNDDEDVENSRGKGKGKAKSGTRSPGRMIKDTGIKDNAIIAFQWRDQGDAATGMEDADWDVILPQFDDVYGVEGVLDGDAVPESRR